MVPNVTIEFAAILKSDTICSPTNQTEWRNQQTTILNVNLLIPWNSDLNIFTLAYFVFLKICIRLLNKPVKKT